jgi:hypothetical protein
MVNPSGCVPLRAFHSTSKFKNNYKKKNWAGLFFEKNAKTN